MAGGVFKKNEAKVRPGVYVNIANGRQSTAFNASQRGVVVLPLIGYDYGPRDEFLEISKDSPDKYEAQLGRSVYDSENTFMIMINMILQNADRVYVYIPDSGKQASGTAEIGEATLNLKAKYKGTLGNKLQVSSVANPVDGFDVSVYLDGNEVETFESVKDASELADVSDYVEFTGTGALAAFASASLAGGTDETSGKGEITTFLDKCEKIKFNCMAFPSDDAALHAAVLTKIRYIRENIGWKCQAVVPNFPADYEGIINLTNSFSYGDVDLTTAEATAWLAGATAGASYSDSNTYRVVTGATGLIGEKSNEEAIAAIKAGETFFSLNEDGNVMLEYDSNSLVSFTKDTPPQANKNRPLRVYDTWCNDCLETFVPGQTNNDEDGWTNMEGTGKAMLKAYEADHAITNVDLDNDFIVDRSKSIDDKVYITAGLQATDSADKYYITTYAR